MKETPCSCDVNVKMDMRINKNGSDPAPVYSGSLKVVQKLRENRLASCEQVWTDGQDGMCKKGMWKRRLIGKHGGA